MSKLSSSPRQFAPVNLSIQDNTHTLGQVLVRMGKLDPDRVSDVLLWQQEQNCSFGEAATAMGLVTRADVIAALAEQYQYPIVQESTPLQNLSQGLVVIQDPFGPAAEAVRAMRSPLLTNWLGRGMRSLAAVGTRRGDGCTYFAANLAASLAQLGLSTLIVDANLRNPGIAELFNLSSRRDGLSSALRLPSLGPLPILHDVLPSLSLMTAGALPPNPQELLSGQRFIDIVDKLEREFDAVIYDTPAGGETADAHVIAARAGCAVLIARRDRTSFKDVSTLSANLRDAGSNLLGTVLNDD
jgi:protein-tyrosine kinase